MVKIGESLMKIARATSISNKTEVEPKEVQEIQDGLQVNWWRYAKDKNEERIQEVEEKMDYI